MLAVLVSPERATVTNFICASGSRHADWSADYRMYSRERVDPMALFSAARERLLGALPEGAPLVVALDDTMVRKTGPRIHGVKYRRDPLSPKFQTNLVRGQRYLQMSGAWPLADGSAPMIPLDFLHVPGASKLAKDADEEASAAWREEKKQKSLNTQALTRIKALQAACPDGRIIHLCGDGSYTNGAIIKGLPETMVYIGRTRKDMVLHHAPKPPAGGKGRPRKYGDLAPTPEALRQDEGTPWTPVGAYAAGQRHDFKIKTMAPAFWRKSGMDIPLRVVVVAPLGYRLKKGGRLLYRQPAYLVCTDPDLPVEVLLQNYLHRWGIEVNFRDEKNLVGTGEAQVRTESSNATLPAATVAAYGLLRVAALTQMSRGGACAGIPRSKWIRYETPDGHLPPTCQLIRQLRLETFSAALRPGIIGHFMDKGSPCKTMGKIPFDLPAALFSAA